MRLLFFWVGAAFIPSAKARGISADFILKIYRVKILLPTRYMNIKYINIYLVIAYIKHNIIIIKGIAIKYLILFVSGDSI